MCQLDYQETGIYKEATIVGLDRHDAADHEFFSNGDIKINKISAEDHKLQRFDTNTNLKRVLFPCLKTATTTTKK